MTPASELQTHRNLWAAVALGALLDHHKLIKRARRKGNAEKLERELADARHYVMSRDFAEVCSRAGLTIRPEVVLERLIAGEMRFNLTAGRDYDAGGRAAA